MSDNEQTEDAYGAINFGEFRKYMKNKKQKLEAQSKQLQKGHENNNMIFQNTFIHVNGYTPIPSTELKRMIIEYGGNYVHYLVKPEWIMDSINAGRLLPWQSYRTIPTNGQQLSFNKKQNTSLAANPDFIKTFYENSRLHHLATWKEELKEIVEKMDEKYKHNNKKQQQDGLRVIMHIDFDCFFASVGLRERPWLSQSPVAVTHSKGMDKDSSSDIASCNYIAREYKIRNGISMGEALRLCPDLKTIPYEFEKYRQVSETFYEIMFQYADELQAVSVDEALIDWNVKIDILLVSQHGKVLGTLRGHVSLLVSTITIGVRDQEQTYTSR
ncbi:DNA/RNA polymerase [Backusella circina FSU 941]|nr:DNA/RNA polymerase [Backusella circina FSU 941]